MKRLVTESIAEVRFWVEAVLNMLNHEQLGRRALVIRLESNFDYT